MKIIALERELSKATPDLFQLFAIEEAQTAWDLYQVGAIRELYFRADQPMAVLILEAATIEEARKLLDSLPFVREGLIQFDLIPLKAYSGFSRLFGHSPKDEQ